ncbi:MAG: peptidase MA family metallohydrolase [Anaerolineales bacterium]|nr:peptidase MA family metallohydrolase [Anaerolineales bacterium]MDW8160425.1 peptidase MA family metallohydrolase [Anaerolineales bacterium]
MIGTRFGFFFSFFGLVVCAAIPFQVGEEKIECDCHLNYRFGETLTLTGKLPAQPMPAEAHLVFQVNERTILYPLTLDDRGNFEFRSNFQHLPLRPFARVPYWIEGTLSNGIPFSTPREEFFYEDNRFPWKIREQPPFRVHWHRGGLQFAQMALDVAREAHYVITAWFPVQVNEPIEIYLYESPGELRQALQISKSGWIAAHADPALGVILVSVSEGFDQRLQMEQQIPHEMMHLYLYRYRPDAYSNLPVWLREGLATAVELYPNPDYYALLDTAARDRSFLALSSLCETFPQEPLTAYLAYAQSAAVVQYLIEQYGIERVRQLINAYADQYDCEAGFGHIYNFSLRQLEDQWREHRFGSHPTGRALARLVPWGMLLMLVLFGPLLLSFQLLSHSTTGKESR